MFDILPAVAVPDTVSLSPAITQARAESRAAFETLPPGPERDNILIALGLLRKSALKHKVRYRAQRLVQIGDDVVAKGALEDLSVDSLTVSKTTAGVMVTRECADMMKFPTPK
jgi:hypothetical protein